MRIAFIMRQSATEPNGISPIAAETIAHLEAQNAQVDVLMPEAMLLNVDELRPAHDLYVLKSKTALTLSLAGALTLAGATIINSYWSHSLTWDKVASTAVIAAAGVPVPKSWATGKASNLGAQLDDAPLWIKPQRGKQGSGVRRIEQHQELASYDAPVDENGLPLPLFAQRQVDSDGSDFKVYVIGERLWALRRTWPTRTPQDKLGRAVPLPPAIGEAALTCGKALGLELYGVDFLVTGEQFHVIDVNAFPGFHGVPEAPRCLAEHIYQRALQCSESHSASVYIPATSRVIL